jgi:predicted unusual protein kinase regulating ubiquinone biosynthesis (AarF/ABC1/UbiB family)
MLATRLDLLPVQYLRALASLQDAVPPFPTGQARAIIAAALDSPVETVFADFHPIPIAAASLRQVYRARLHTGQTVAVKVQRPGLAGHIALDVEVLRRLARVLQFVSILPGNLDWQGMLDEFHTTILTELDYRQEAQHAERFRRHFARWTDVYVPRLYPAYSTSRVLVMEYIAGFKVTETAKLTARQKSPFRC